MLRPPRIESYETPSPPEPAVQDWLNNRAPRLIPSRHREYTPVPLGLVDYFNTNIHLPQVAMLIATHTCHNEDATADARRHKREFSPTTFLRVPPADTVMSGTRLPDPPSISPTPETLPRTALASSPSIIPPRPLSSDRSSRGPYTKGKDAATGMAYTVKGKGADKGTFKGKDNFSSDRPPPTPGPPKGSSKNSPGVTFKGSAKGPEKGKPHGKGIAPPAVFAPPANLPPPGRPGRP